MNTAVLWRTLHEPGLEHLVLSYRTDAIIADGSVIGVSNGQPFRLSYVVECDASFQVRRVQLTTVAPFRHNMVLLTDGNGAWVDETGVELVALRGCAYVDINVSPFTNTLPIRTLGLTTGASAEVNVVYIDVPVLKLTKVRQRYTRLPSTDAMSVYHYESLEDGFSADIYVDSQGLVMSYADIFERVSLP